MNKIIDKNELRKVMCHLTDLEKYEFVCGAKNEGGFGRILDNLTIMQGEVISARDFDRMQAKRGSFNASVKKWLIPVLAGWDRRFGTHVLGKFIKDEKDYINLVSDLDDFFTGM